MSNIKKGLNMNAAKLLTVRKRYQTIPTQIAQGHVRKDLFDAVKKEADKHDTSLREIINWAFECFLLEKNPQLAAKLGVGEE